ncbi:MAG: DUF3784 domain-containing protein [Blautia sp.]|nr:DUF3784 domain-containing protein [Blautia sp.]
MTDQTWGWLLAVVSFVIGILVLTGNGDFFLKGANEAARKKMYDMDKLTKASGVALLLFGVVTLIDSFTTGLLAKIVYLVAVIVILAGFIVYLKKKCRR